LRCVAFAGRVWSLSRCASLSSDLVVTDTVLCAAMVCERGSRRRTCDHRGVCCCRRLHETLTTALADKAVLQARVDALEMKLSTQAEAYSKVRGCRHRTCACVAPHD
jgi:hypothetical protein